jgi:D-glycero-beta-D-manno-heptose 1-phosphate adenylyltransferase
MEKNWQNAAQKKLLNPNNDLANIVDTIKKDGKTIATLNGSFDLVHAGHLEIIYQASCQADVLIVAMNTDRSIQSYKGKNRPIIPLLYRLQMMAAIGFVDYVTWFDENNPIKILEKIKPNVHVNGQEYGDNCIESDVIKKYGGVIHLVDIIPNLSTSLIIKKIVSCD